LTTMRLAAVAVMLLPLVAGQYNPAWGPNPCPNGRCLPKWTPTYNSEPPPPLALADCPLLSRIVQVNHLHAVQLFWQL
jgi:hypothetical protein